MSAKPTSVQFIRLPRRVLGLALAWLLVIAPVAVFAADDGASATSTNYVIRRGDVLSFSVFEEPEMKRELRVEADGAVILPLVGKVPVEGRSIEQLHDQLTALYDRDYLVNPQITLQVVNYARKGVQIIGEVNRPGNVGFPDEKPLTLLEAIAAAGGFTRRANAGKISIRRTTEAGEQSIIKVDASEVLSDPTKKDVQLHDGDTIFVGERWI